jgi:hypothetical protein
VKPLLTRLTFGLAGVIVAVLATYLILIAAALFRANRNLDQLASGLEAVRDNTAPLETDLTTVNDAATTLNDRLSLVNDHLAGASQSLQR